VGCVDSAVFCADNVRKGCVQLVANGPVSEIRFNGFCAVSHQIMRSKSYGGRERDKLNAAVR
jgi:hypothetical protein